eukprot:74428-Rhodomonas_salina.4
MTAASGLTRTSPRERTQSTERLFARIAMSLRTKRHASSHETPRSQSLPLRCLHRVHGFSTASFSAVSTLSWPF